MAVRTTLCNPGIYLGASKARCVVHTSGALQHAAQETGAPQLPQEVALWLHAVQTEEGQGKVP